MGIQVSEITKGKMPWKREFIDFTFDGHRISDYGLVAVVDGDRYTLELSSEFQDEVSEVNGRHGQIYWGTKFKPKKREFTLATDGITETQLRRFKADFAPGKYGQFAEDAWFGRYCYARIAEPPKLSFVAFKGTETINGVPTQTNIFKGELKISFIQDDPFTYSFFNITTDSILNVLRNRPNMASRAALHSGVPFIDSWKNNIYNKCCCGDDAKVLAAPKIKAYEECIDWDTITSVNGKISGQKILQIIKNMCDILDETGKWDFTELKNNSFTIYNNASPLGKRINITSITYEEHDVKQQLVVQNTVGGNQNVILTYYDWVSDGGADIEFEITKAFESDANVDFAVGASSVGFIGTIPSGSTSYVFRDVITEEDPSFIRITNVPAGADITMTIYKSRTVGKGTDSVRIEKSGQIIFCDSLSVIIIPDAKQKDVAILYSHRTTGLESNLFKNTDTIPYYNPSETAAKAYIEMEMDFDISSRDYYSYAICDSINNPSYPYNTITISERQYKYDYMPFEEKVKVRYTTPAVIYYANRAVQLAAQYEAEDLLDFCKMLQKEITHANLLDYIMTIFEDEQFEKDGYLVEVNGIKLLKGLWRDKFKSKVWEFFLDQPFTLILNGQKNEAKIRYKHKSSNGQNYVQSEESCGDCVLSEYLELEGKNQLAEDGTIDDYYLLKLKRGGEDFAPVSTKLLYHYTYL